MDAWRAEKRQAGDHCATVQESLASDGRASHGVSGAGGRGRERGRERARERALKEGLTEGRARPESESKRVPASALEGGAARALVKPPFALKGHDGHCSAAARALDPCGLGKKSTLSLSSALLLSFGAAEASPGSSVWWK